MYLTLEEMSSQIAELQKIYLRRYGEQQNIQRLIVQKEENIAALQKEADNLTIGKKIMEEGCKEAREQGRQLLELMTSMAIESVFQDDSAVKLTLTEKADSTTLDVRMTTKDENGNTVVTDPALDGGGLRDILSAAFFVAVGTTVKDNHAPFVLDEPSKFVSKGELAENFAEYMRGLSTYSGKQMIVATHDEALLKMGDAKYNIEKVGNFSQVTREV
jgi:DNA repair exonuclease SbcCD ATPase subunit